MNNETIHNTDWAKYIVENFLPIDQTDQIKYIYPIELELICQGDNIKVEGMLRKCGISSFPEYANGHGGWYSGQPLNFGSVCGWDVTADGEYALCRVAFLDYRLFKVIKKSAVEKKASRNNDLEQMKNKIKELEDNQRQILELMQDQIKNNKNNFDNLINLINKRS